MRALVLRHLPRLSALLSRRAARFGLAALLTLAIGLPGFAGGAAAQPPAVRIGFCPGGGGVATITITVVIACPAQTTLSATVMAPCVDAAAVMAAVDGAMGGFMFGGGPVFGPPVVVPGGVAGQTRHEWPLSPGFLSTNCVILSIDLDFDCGTMGLAVLLPAVPHGPIVHGPMKLAVIGPPPGPAILVIKFEGCPPISVVLDGTESATAARDKVLAALLAAGYSAHIGPDGRIVVDTDCIGLYPVGIDEYGLSGGAPMHLGMGSCPPPAPTETRTGTWGALKSLYR